MGNAKSKNKKGSSRKGHDVSGQNTQQNRVDANEELLSLKEMISQNPEIFVLNNLMMCVQFFGNYEEEIEHVRKSLVSSCEAELNQHLPPQKHVLLPDVLQEHIAGNVVFTSTRQTLQPTLEPLHPIRIYTVHENIDIGEMNYTSHYSSMNDAIVYNMLLKPTEHQGYVQLQLLEETTALRKTVKEDDIDLSSIAENDDELYSDSDSVYGPKPYLKINLGERYKQRNLGNLTYADSRSLPNLHDQNLSKNDEIPSDSKFYGIRSSLNVKAESDHENMSSAYEHRQGNRKGWYRGDRQVPRSKMQRSAESRSASSSMSSGYRSGNNIMDNDSRCNTSQNMRFTNESQSDTMSCTSRGDDIDDYRTMNAVLPTRCFKKICYKPDGTIYDAREETKKLMNSKQQRIELGRRKYNRDLCFVSSTEFMKHFKNLFKHRLAEPLGFDQEAVKNMKREGCVLYCDKVMVLNSYNHIRIEQYEIIPAVWLAWPACAQEWLDRPRNSWPDLEDVRKIKDFGCYVVPEGFEPRKGSNLHQDLEWKLIFPTAERYLETCMTEAQTQVYLVALVLHKTFIRPVLDKILGMTTAHIRNNLFWLIEENDRQAKWRENRTGECLIKLLNSLYTNISQNEPVLRDYFVRKRNLFQRLPSKNLLHTQKQLKRIIDNPVMYVFHAMESIRHRDNFFPRFDYESLLQILTADIPTLVNPALAQHISNTIPKYMELPSENYEKYSSTGFWDNVKNQRERKLYPTRPVVNKTLINPRKAADSVIEIEVQCGKLNAVRLYALLNFFADHFIKIAKRFHEYGAQQQKNVYLNQANLLSTLLKESQRYKSNAEAYQDEIKALRDRSIYSRSQSDPPETPKRNLEAPIFVALLKDRFLLESPKAEDEQSQNQTDHQNHADTISKAIVHNEKSKSEEESTSRVTTRILKNEEVTRPEAADETKLPNFKEKFKKNVQVKLLIDPAMESSIQTTYV